MATDFLSPFALWPDMTAAPPPEADRTRTGFAPPQSRDVTWVGRALAVGGALLSAIYLANLGVGVVELIPDNIPVAGNIDEVLFTLLLIYCLRRLGIDLAPHMQSRLGQRKP